LNNDRSLNNGFASDGMLPSATTLGRRISEGGLNSETGPSDVYYTNRGQVIEDIFGGYGNN
jgi:hypothetical protein